jgi:hypothetical protein
MKIHKRKLERIARLSAQIIQDWEWIQRKELLGLEKPKAIEKVRTILHKNEEKLTTLTDEFTPDELIEQVTDENFQALNCAGDYGNKDLQR